MKKIRKILLKYFIIFICLILLFIVLLTLSSLIPKEGIKDNVKETAGILNEQTNALYMPVREWIMYFDNCTDALMINTAYSIDSSTPFYSAMVARKNYIPGMTEIIYEDEAGELRSASKYEKQSQVEELNDTVNNDITESFEYARYWHGYLCLLRPALLLGNIGEIRLTCIVIFMALYIALGMIIAKKTEILYAIAVAARNTWN